MPKLEAVVVCINYADFLAVTLPNNKNFFNKLVVVTDMQDTETPRVCEFNNVMCVRTNAMYREVVDGKVTGLPNKGIAINEGLKKLDMDGWVVQLDADIWLPTMTRSIIDRFPLRPESVYGIDRLMCNSYDDWIKYYYLGKPIHEGWIYLHLHQFHVGQRIVKYNNDGFLPIGFFQLWNPKGSGIKDYPTSNEAFDRTDTLFSKRFPRQNREFMPDLACIHLASEEAHQGQNWYGRKTRKFAPSILTKYTVGYKIRRWFNNLWRKIACAICPPKGLERSKKHYSNGGA